MATLLDELSQLISALDDDGEVLPLDFLLVTPKVEDVWETKETLI